jgi:hypothetical protein
LICYAGLYVVAIAFMFRFLSETKGLSAEEITEVVEEITEVVEEITEVVEREPGGGSCGLP